ncbi:MAG: hypothetical protein ACHQ1H_09530 [Nitrososphaerales archaeon]
MTKSVDLLLGLVAKRRRYALSIEQIGTTWSFLNYVWNYSHSEWMI